MSPQQNEVDLADLRKQLIEAVLQLEPQHRDRVSAEMIQKFVEMNTGEVHTLTRIGNNLRVLKKRGVLHDVRIRGHRYWRCTGRKYDSQEDAVHRALVAFPKSLHTRIVKYAKLAGLSRTAFVVNMVGIGLSSLEPMEASGELGLPSEQE
jgi:hypothetical protein